jgi:amino-acid N-acetyltransferase
MMTRLFSYDIRPASPKDLEAVEALLQIEHLPVEGVREQFRNFLVAEGTYSPRVPAAPIGAIGLELYGTSALVRSAVVDSAWRGRGVGGALVDKAIAAARARGVGALYLLTTTAEPFFSVLGFRVVSRDDVPADVKQSVEFVSACPASATVMLRQIAEART